jgi:2-polyprenyl-3-methyl-5-hydroxy-6-metoxy-1,4-benzoquinol methylase
MNVISSLKMWGRPLICPFDDMLAYLPPGVSSFDIGCGTGYLLARIAAEKKPAFLGGIEMSRRLALFARDRVRRVSETLPVEIGVYDGHALPESLSRYDYVWMVDVLHHIPPAGQAGALHGIAARMKPGAVLILKDIDAARKLLCLANKLHDLLAAGEIGHERSAPEAAAMVREAGLEITQRGARRKVVYPHYWLVCRKP